MPVNTESALVTPAELQMKPRHRLRTQDALLLLFGPCMALIAKFNHNWEYSCVMTLGQASMALAVAQIFLRVSSGEHVGPISTQTLRIMAMALGARFVPTMLKEGYTPVDNTGNWLAQAFDAIAFLFTVMVLWKVRGREAVGCDKYRWIAPAVMLLSLMLAVVGHSNLDDSVPMDITWATATFALVLALLPQLLRLQLAPLGDGPLPWAYVVPLCGAVLGSSLFWLVAEDELYIADSNDEIESVLPGRAVFAADVVWIVLATQCAVLNAWRTMKAPAETQDSALTALWFV